MARVSERGPFDLTEVAARIDELKDRVAVSATGCWEWTGKTSANGYGYVYHRGRDYLAHRVFYTAHKGVPALGLDLDHLCRNRICVNPDHLEQVTRQVNIQRGKDAVPRKTRCIHGHSLDDAYTYSWGRCCRTCALARAAAQRAAKKGVA